VRAVWRSGAAGGGAPIVAGGAVGAAMLRLGAAASSRSCTVIFRWRPLMELAVASLSHAGTAQHGGQGGRGAAAPGWAWQSMGETKDEST
jgi:hypothetical protein